MFATCRIDIRGKRWEIRRDLITSEDTDKFRFREGVTFKEGVGDGTKDMSL